MLKSAPTSAPPPNNNLFGSLLLSDPSSIPAKPLPLAGWNIRYEFKLGHLAEIRQEYEVAVR